MGKKDTKFFGSVGIQSLKWRQVEPEGMSMQKCVQAFAFRPLLSQYYLCGIKKNKKTTFKDWIGKHSMTRRLRFVQGGEGEKMHSAANAL